jgi:hypothetical protein
MDFVTPFFVNSPFTKSATYTPSEGAAKTVTVIFDAPFQLTSAQGLEYQNAEPQCLVATSDVADANDQATILIDAVTYKVREVQPDGTGITRLILSRDTV